MRHIPLFDLGRILATPGALESMMLSGLSSHELLARHVSGDWGDLGEEDRAENEYSLDRPLRILSAYTLPTGVQVWVITEADRSATTFLLPEEY